MAAQTTVKRLQKWLQHVLKIGGETLVTKSSQNLMTKTAIKKLRSWPFQSRTGTFYSEYPLTFMNYQDSIET